MGRVLGLTPSTASQSPSPNGGGERARGFLRDIPMTDQERPVGAEGEAVSVPAKWVRSRQAVHWDAGLADRLVARVAAGELLYAVLREEGMPTPQSVGRWARERKAFGAALRAARRAGGRPSHGGGGVWTYCDSAAREVFERLCEGESLNAIGADPTMPSVSTIFYWRRKVPEFADAVRVGKEIQAERACAEGWELAQAATPETAYLTHVRLTQLRWMAGVMAPKTYRLKLVAPDAPREVETVLFRHFEIEVDAETGQRKVVSFCPNPETGVAEREDAPGWRPPDGVRLPG
jgi:hypothetical protein